MLQYLYYVPVAHLPASQREELGHSLCYDISRFTYVIIRSDMTIMANMINQGMPLQTLAVCADVNLHSFFIEKRIPFLYPLETQ